MQASRTLLEQAHGFYDAHSWRDAFEALTRADSVSPLGHDDLERLAWSAGLAGEDKAFLSAHERLYKELLRADQRSRAARSAFWIGLRMWMLGSQSGSTGWLARADRLVNELEKAGAERGYLLLVPAYRNLGQGKDSEAEVKAREASAIGVRHGDSDLSALARTIEARALLGQGLVAPGIELLDEVMVSATSEELSPIVMGIVYCGAIDTCHQFFVVDRAHEWTAAFAKWCERQPQVEAFNGQCLVHLAEFMHFCGDFVGAIQEVRRICHRAGDGDPEVYGEACYLHGELLRILGDVSEAEAAFRLSSECGREPQPGLALLRLAQGQTEEALSALRRVLSTSTANWERARLLPAFVEVALAAGKRDEADNAAQELEGIAGELGTEALCAMSSHARGAVALAQGDALGASGLLKHAFGVWHRAGATYMAARIRVLLGLAFLALGDRDGAALELSAAQKAFAQMGAIPEQRRLEAEMDTVTREACGDDARLSARELEVLRLVARGMTNKAIAAQLVLSDRTVDRHVSNILSKIGESSRAAATAYAFRNGIVRP
jgi:ATP/maltotriose-dependent transcriptional regulator MalT